MDRIIDSLTGLLNTPSPSGYTDKAVAYVACAIEAVAGHVDTPGAMVREVKSNVRLLMTQLGGYAWQVGLIGPGIDARHDYERTDCDSLEASAQLVAQYLLDPAGAESAA